MRDEFQTIFHFCYDETAVNMRSSNETRGTRRTHTHTHSHAPVNYVTVCDVIQGPSPRAEGVKGSMGRALPRVVTAPERVRRNARDDR